MKSSLTKTRQSFLARLGALAARNRLDEEFWAGLEETLIAADVGVETTIALVGELRVRVEREHVREPLAVEMLLKEELIAILQSAATPPSRASSSAYSRPEANRFPPDDDARPPHAPHPSLHVILAVGVNGSGKTTSIAKLAHHYKKQGARVILAAADTFRAAAIDQLKIWGQRVGVDVVAHQPGADPAAVAFDAWEAASAHRADVLIVDTAGRLQTKFNLMKELEKIARVLKKNDPSAPHETLLVVDAVTGQNGLPQARAFKEATPLTGLILAKLDGTAKGGIVFAIAKELSVPIRFVGTGEEVEDFAEFDAKEFVEGLFE